MEIYYDLNKEWRCSPLGVRLNGNMPVLRYKEKPVWNLHFLKDGDPCGTADFGNAVSFRAAVDVDLNAESDVICRTTDESIGRADLSSGILVVPLNANTTGFRSAADGQESRKAFFELWGFNSDADPVFYLRFEIRISGVVDPEGGAAPESVSTDVITRAEVMACLRAPDERQYTSDPADSSAAHSSQTSSDTYTRRRNSAVAGEWGPWEALIPGPSGEPGLDGLTPVISGGSVVTLPPGTPAAAALVSSGANTYYLHLGLPEGEAGSDGCLSQIQVYDPASAYSAMTCLAYNGGGYQVLEATSAGETPDNASSKFVCFASAGGIPDFQVIHEGGSSIVPMVNHAYRVPLSSGTSISINSSGLTSSICVTQELWLDMPSTPVVFTLPAFTWVDGAVPDFAFGNRRYVITVRWDGEDFLANLAIDYAKVFA
jgi:hypothetical protein